MDTFKVCVENPFMNCEKIFPVAQHDVKALLEYLLPDDSIKQVIIFGSATENRFQMWSDIDVYVDGLKIVYTDSFSKAVGYDIRTPSMVDERLLKVIYETGVVVYERAD